MLAKIIRWASHKKRELSWSGVSLAVLVLVTFVTSRSATLSQKLGRVGEDLEIVATYSHVFEAAVTIVALAVLLAIWLRPRAPPPGHLGVASLLEMPARPNPSEIAFQVPAKTEDLEPFCAWSDDEPDIAERYPHLHGASRRRLYQEWLRINPKSFLTLSRFDARTQTWAPIAVSIVLPLRKAGYERLVSGHSAIVDMRDHEIAPAHEATDCLLIDTWIVKPELRANKHELLVRDLVKRYARALVFVHLSQFWDGRSDLRLVVEADNKHVFAACKRLGFDGSQRSKDGEIIQTLVVVAHPNDRRLALYFSALSRNVDIARHWLSAPLGA